MSTGGLTRFFYHYHRHGEHKMTVHFKGVCHQVDQVKCYVPCESKFNKRQPLLVMRGHCSNVSVRKVDGARVATIRA